MNHTNSWDVEDLDETGKETISSNPYKETLTPYCNINPLLFATQ